MAEPVQSCLHVTQQQDLPFEKKALFTKKSYKTYASNGSATKHELNTADDCPLCFAYGFRRGALEYMERTRPKAKLIPPSGFEKKHVNEEQYDRGKGAGSVYQELPLSHPGSSGVNNARLVFPIHKGQNGEQYHAIVCSFLSNCEPECIKLHTTKETTEDKPATQEQLDLLYYYLPSKVIKAGDTTSKKAATEYIANVFKNLDTPGKQAERYNEIREFLDDGGLQPHAGGNYYISPSYTAKYWLNRYFELTGQGRKLPKSDPDHPEHRDVKMAVIMLRTKHKAGDPRMMTDNHLTRCLDAIRAANQVADARQGGKPISHVLLYGDKTTLQMQNFINDTHALWRKQKKDGPRLLYLTSPFNTDGNEEVNQFWANFRSIGDTLFSKVPETVPVEAKVLAIFVALQKRYRNKICAIGFRSGTLDGAGFVGIPIFFLDDVSSSGKWSVYKDLRYIWDGNSTGAKNDERMAYAGQMMNTFVRVNIEDKYDPPASGGVVKASHEELRHLGAALYTYMFHENEGLDGHHDGADLLWLKRVSMMKGQGKAVLESRCDAFLEGLEKTIFKSLLLNWAVPEKGAELIKVQTRDWVSTDEKSWPTLDLYGNGERLLVKVRPLAINTPTLDLMSFISYIFFIFIFVFFCVVVFS